MFPDINRLPPSARAQLAHYPGAIKPGVAASRAYFFMKAFPGSGITNGEIIGLVVGSSVFDPNYRIYRLEFRTDVNWTAGGGHCIDLHMPFLALDTEATIQDLIWQTLSSPAAPPNGTGNNVAGSQYFVANPLGTPGNLWVNAYIRDDVHDAIAVQASAHWTYPMNLANDRTGIVRYWRPYQLRAPLLAYGTKGVAFPYRVIEAAPVQFER